MLLLFDYDFDIFQGFLSSLEPTRLWSALTKFFEELRLLFLGKRVHKGLDLFDLYKRINCLSLTRNPFGHTIQDLLICKALLGLELRPDGGLGRDHIGVTGQFPNDN